MNVEEVRGLHSGFRTLWNINDQLRLSAENKKGFGGPQLQSSHRETEGGKDGWKDEGK